MGRTLIRHFGAGSFVFNRLAFPTCFLRCPCTQRQKGSHTLTHVVCVILKEVAVERTPKPPLLKTSRIYMGAAVGRTATYYQWVPSVKVVLKVEFP